MPRDPVPDDHSAGQTVQVPQFAIGQQLFRRYILMKILGRGGMGVVWLARDMQLETLTALKVLPETLYHDHAALDALKRETKVGLNLAHPNIVRIYDFQRDDDAAALSMEYVDGPTLSDLRITRPHQVFSVGDLLPHLDALCDALNYAHNREKVIHRDLKPRNLMLNSKAKLKITDFGISRSITESMTMATGQLGSAGSPPYISPQQWDGDRPTALDDIYSVGATLYELLSSKPPLIGVVEWEQVHHKIPPPIWKRRLDLDIKATEPVPAQWEEVIAACLAKDPKDRPQTIRELQARLTGRPLIEEPLPEEPTPPPPEAAALPINLDTDRTVEIPPLEEQTLRDTQTPQDDDFDAVTVTSVSARKPRERRKEIPLEKGRKKIPLWFWLSGAGATVLLATIAFFFLRPTTSQLGRPSSKDLMIETEPSGATVTLDQGQPTRAPHTFEKVKFGSHRLSITLEGYLPIEKELNFEGAALPKIVLQPKPAPVEEFGRLAVRCDPPGAIIRLDGAPPQEPPGTFTKVRLGKHKLTALLEGYESKEQDVIVESGTVEVVLSLEPSKQAQTATPIPTPVTTPTPKPVATPTPKPIATPSPTSSPKPTPPPTATPDPINGLIEEVKGYERAQDWSKHHRSSLALIQRLTTDGGSISAEHQEALRLVMDGLRNKGLGLNKDEFRAYEDNIRSAAHLDILPAILILADNLRLKNAPEAFDWYYYAADARHNPEAEMNLAWLYFGGKCGQRPDKETAFKWFKRAFESGSTAAGTVVANCYLRGEGTPKDEEAAIRILLPLADGGEARAMTLIGQCYYNGTGHLANLPQNERDQKAKAYFEKAISGGEWAACGHLGVMYETGRGVPKDWKAAVKLYLKGVDNQNPVCMYYYALALENHRSEIAKMTGREDKAETYYKKAAAASVTQAVQWCIEHNIKY